MFATASLLMSISLHDDPGPGWTTPIECLSGLVKELTKLLENQAEVADSEGRCVESGRIGIAKLTRGFP